MALAGYVVPGQIICPLYEKVEQGIRRYRAGPGVITSKFANGSEALTASVVGKVSITADLPAEHKDPSTSSNSESGDVIMHGGDLVQENTSTSLNGSLNLVVSVENRFKAPDSLNKVTRTGSALVPEINDVVLARVTKLTLRQAHVEILAVESQGAITADSGVGFNGPTEGVVSSGTGGGQGSASNASADVGEGFGGIIRIQDIRAADRDKVKIASCFRPGDIVRALVISLGDGTNYYLSTARNELGVVFARSRTGELMYPLDWQTMKSSKTGLTEPRKCAKPF